MKALVQTILPRIALYKVLQAELPAEETFAHMRTYMMDWVAAEKHAFTAKMELVPGFYRIYSYCFLEVMRTSDLWESTQAHDKNALFPRRSPKCLWHTACRDNGCPELCPLFCDVDDVTYGGLRKLGFCAQKRWAAAVTAAIFVFQKIGEQTEKRTSAGFSVQRRNPCCQLHRLRSAAADGFESDSSSIPCDFPG